MHELWWQRDILRNPVALPLDQRIGGDRGDGRGALRQSPSVREGNHQIRSAAEIAPGFEQALQHDQRLDRWWDVSGTSPPQSGDPRDFLPVVGGFEEPSLDV